jgi:membrane fusion protein (multidrug efflux system)
MRPTGSGLWRLATSRLRRTRISSRRIATQEEKPAGAGSAGIRSRLFSVCCACCWRCQPEYLYWDYTSHYETTDDAYIAARQFAIAPEVSGYITAVPVTDNEHVAAGGLIARIDDRTYRAALAQAEAQVAAARASIDNIDGQLSVQQAQIAADQAQLAQQQAAVVFAQQQAARYQYLAHTIAGTVQNAQQYTSQLRQQQAAVDSAQATLKLAQRQVEALKAQRASDIANLAQGKAQRDEAQINLGYTTVTADQPGRVVQLSARGRAIRAAGHKPDDVRPR